MTAADLLARELADLRRRLVALERSGQLSASTIDDAAGNPVQVSDGILAGLTAEAKAAEALAKAVSAEAKADGAVTVFYQADAPTTPTMGDFWVNTVDDGKTSTWNGFAWQVLTSQAVADALTAASTAQAAADGKIVTYWQTAAPATANLGDLWYDTDAGNAVHRWGGSAWVALPVGSGALADQAVTGNKLEADLAVIGAIRSPNYVAGTSGWAIKGDGSVDLNDVTARGALRVGTAPTYIKVDSSVGQPAIIGNPDSAAYSDGSILSQVRVIDGGQPLTNILSPSPLMGMWSRIGIYGDSIGKAQPGHIVLSPQGYDVMDVKPSGVDVVGNVAASGDISISGNMSVTGIGQRRTVLAAGTTATNTTTMKNADGLALSVVPGTYSGHLALLYTAVVAQDLSYSWLTPSGSTGVRGMIGPDATAASALPTAMDSRGSSSFATVWSVGGRDGNYCALFEEFTLIVTTSGTVQLQFAQTIAATGTSAAVLANSKLTLERTA